MKQITLSDRIVIEAGICTGKSIKKISEDIGKNPSTVSREIRTNRSFIRGSFYLPDFETALSKMKNYAYLRKEYEYIEVCVSLQNAAD